MKPHFLVVLIEDNDKLRQVTTLLLEHAGFHVSGVSCAEDVDDLELPRPPDLYVVDLNLPGEDGISLARRLRKGNPRAGIVITSGRTHLDDRVVGYESGADIYLVKPVASQELVAALNSVVRRSKDDESHSSCWTLDFARMYLAGPESKAKLSKPETQLLAALATAPQQTLQYWQSSLHLVGPDNELSNNTLQVRISALRKKFKLCGARNESIRAIRGEGYRLCFPLIVI
ncbi:MAG: response regulator transcription factor [Sideroxydans sp.]|jgi:DNA-binding response OmpR family regulator